MLIGFFLVIARRMQSYRGEASAWVLVVLAVLSALLRHRFGLLPLPLPSALGGFSCPLHFFARQEET